ncbi:MAG: GxxExxY protein [Verrucomicrobiae bacterium]|nr:GxxExxY protein [Verrucomicrobiae bacterium]MDW8344061.1 GxxExxY protein [Verrucomicrobiae bacterium]
MVAGDYVSDLVVAGKVIAELKSEEDYNKTHVARLASDSKAIGMKVGLSINFGKAKCELRQFVMWCDYHLHSSVSICG